MENSIKMEGKDQSDTQRSNIGLLRKKTKMKNRSIISSLPGACHSEARSLSLVSVFDGTSDFSGGCTPYKVIAKNVADKQRSSNHNRKQLKMEKLKSKVTKVKTGQTSFDVVTTSHEYDAGKIVNLKACVTCGKGVVNDAYENHIKECLKSRFQRFSSTGSKTQEEEQHLSDCVVGNAQPQTSTEQTVEDITQHESDVCQFCQQNLSHLNFHRHTLHINRCMDKAEEDEAKKAAAEEALRKAKDKVLDCPLCGQSLKTSKSRKTHMKRCAKNYDVSASVLRERIQEQEAEYKILLEAGILPTMTRSNRRNRQPAQGSMTRPATNQRSSELQQPEQPNSKLDEETQLALALSESLYEESGRKSKISVQNFTQNYVHVTDTCQDNVQTRKDAFSVLMTPKHDAGGPKKKYKKNKLAEKSYEIVNQTCEQRMTRLEAKLATLMFSQEEGDICLTPKLPSSRIATDLSCMHEPKSCILWAADSTSHADRDIFYVKQLQPQVFPSHVMAGSKLKKMSNIPGWKPLYPLDVIVVQVQSDNDGEPSTPDSTTANQTLLATTQTALLLAELAGNATTLDITCDQNSTINSGSASQRSNGQFKPNKTVHFAVPEEDDPSEVEPQGFCSPTENNKRQKNALQNLVDDLKRLLNNSNDSDTTIVCRGRETIQAHSLMIQLRCPVLFQDINEGKVELTDYPSECIKALLRYVYSSDVNVPNEIAMELRHLAKRLELDELALSCADVAQKKDPTKNTNACEYEEPIQSHKLIDDTLQNLLHDAWGSDSDISDDENIEAKSSNPGIRNTCHKNVNDDLELDEIYELVASQKQTDSCSEGEKDEQCSEDMEKSSGQARSISNMLNFALMQTLEQSFMVDAPKIMLTTSQHGVQNINKSETEQIRPDLLHKCHLSDNNDMDNDIYNIICEPQDESNDVSSSKEEAGDVILSDQTSSIHNCFRKYNSNKQHNSTQEHDDTMPDMFSQASSGEESINIDTHLERAAADSNSYKQLYVSSPGDDLFDSDDSADEQENSDIADECLKNNLLNSVCQMAYSPDRFQTMKASKDSTDDYDEPLRQVNEAHSSKQSFMVAVGVSSQHLNSDLPVFTSKLARECSSGDTSLKSLLGKQQSSHWQTEQTMKPSSGEKRKRLDIAPFNSDVENSSLDEQMKKNRKLADGGNFAEYNYAQKKMHDISHSEDESSPVFKKQNSTRTQSLSKADASMAFIDLTLEENNTETDITRSHSQFIGQLSLEALHSPMYDSIATSADVLSKSKSARCVEAGEMSCASSDHSESDCDEGNTRELAVEESGYSAPDNWMEVEQIDDYDFGITATQGLGTLPNDNMDMTIYDHNCDLDSPSKELSLNTKAVVVDDVFTSAHSGHDSEEDVVVGDDIPGVVEPETSDSVLLNFACNNQTSRQITNKAGLNGWNKTATSHFHTPTHLPSKFRSKLHSPEYDPPTDIDSDISMMLDDADDNMLIENDNEKHLGGRHIKSPPKKAKKLQSKRPQVPPSPFTPMMDYKKMNTPELKKQCQKFGIQPLPKKKMIVILSDIYDKTHSYETDSDYDGSPPPRKSTSSQPEDQYPELNVKKCQANSKTSTMTTYDVNVKRAKGKEQGKVSDIFEGKSCKTRKAHVAVPDDTDDVMHSSQDLNSSSCSQESDQMVNDLPEESILQVEDTEQDKKLSKKDVAYKKQCVWEYILGNESLHLQILRYEPLDFSSFHQQLKSSGLNIGAKIVMDFLDDQNVLFTMKNQQASRRKRQSKKGISQSLTQRQRPRKQRKT